MITDDRIKAITLGLFKQESARDKQIKIGASDFSDPCEYHLAKKLKGIGGGTFKYWLGAKIGTATHEFLEKRIETVDIKEYPEFKDAKVEQTIVLGELEGYGTIKSKPDLVLVNGGHLVDWKTSKRDKSKKLQNVIYGLSEDADSMYTLKKYYAQAQIYAWGLNKEGTKIDGCSLVFINRDGTYDPDIWSYTFEYDKDFAQKMWERLERIWKEVSSGKELEEFQRESHCFNCKVIDGSQKIDLDNRHLNLYNQSYDWMYFIPIRKPSARLLVKMDIANNDVHILHPSYLQGIQGTRFYLC